MKPSDSLADAIAVVASFVPVEPSQEHSCDQILRFAAANDDALYRTCVAGHFTASAWLVDHSAHAGLVLLHTKIGRWLQPGGHADGDACLVAVALRECTEETGISGLEVYSEPIDVDVHLFHNRLGTEPDHLHLDVRYVVRAPVGAVACSNHESEQLRWVTEDELGDPALGLDTGTVRLAHHGFKRARHGFEQARR